MSGLAGNTIPKISAKTRREIFMYTFTSTTPSGDKKVESVEAETWGWGVLYKDGSELKQFSPDKTFHQFKEVNQPEVKMFVMYKLDDMSKRIDMPISEPLQLFHFYRKITLNMLQEDERKVHIYVFGWKNTLKDTVSYNYILPDDRIITADHDIIDLTQYAV